MHTESPSGYLAPGRMQDWPLTLDRLIDNAARWHGRTEIVSRLPSGVVVRSNYARLRAKARRISAFLLTAGLRPGDRVATLAFNSHDHLALWYGIMGIGAVCHTLNPRLPPEQLRYIVDHAGDRMLFNDACLELLAQCLVTTCPTIERTISINGARSSESLDTLLDCVDETVVRWGGFAETTTAGLCYTSGTTGDPKGVAYTHRSNYLHALITASPDAFSISSRDVVMPVVPMYHANSWGLAYSATASGATLVLPGSMLDGQSLHLLIEQERVTFAAGVPTVWQGYVEYLRNNGIGSTSLRRVIVGGSACPPSLMTDLEAFGATVIHAWGMTELSPVGLVGTTTREVECLEPRERQRLLQKQGRPIGIDARIVDDDGDELPRDGVSPGRLEVRGPAVAEAYAGAGETALNGAGWFDTGDIATIDPLGYVEITDRAKDIIKSGGEWISSVAIENAALTHPNVAMAAVIAIDHPRWGERPKLYIQLRRPDSAPASAYRDHLEGLIAKWWLPDEVEVIEAIPLGSTGKIDKKALRARSAL